MMDKDTMPHWSYSSLNCYLQCPLKYAFRYIEQAPIERTGVCFPFGRAFHAVLSMRAFKGPSFKLEEAYEDFSVYFKGETEVSENLVYKQDETFDSCLHKGFELLNVAFDNFQDDYAVKRVAEPFSVTVPSLSKPLVGEFDLVVTDGGDEAVVDWKTASSRWQAGKADRELQATAYCYAYRKRHGVLPLFRYDVYTKTKQPTVNSLYTSRTEDDLNRFEHLCQQVERCVNAEAFYPNESIMNCSECPYKNRCKQWKGRKI